jgi:hypothetical protein
MELSVPLFIRSSKFIISSDYLQIWTIKCFNQQLVFRRASNSLPLETDAQKVGLDSLIKFKIAARTHTRVMAYWGAEKGCDTLSNDSIVMLLFLHHTSAMKCYALET